MKNRYSLADFYPKETFYRIPKQLLKDDRYYKLSNDAIVTYAIFQDRFELSLKNHWIDDKNYVYFYFTLDEIQQLLRKSRTTVMKIKSELNTFSLIEEVRQGVNKPNRIYLLKPESQQIKGSPETGLPINGLLEVQKLDSNDTELNYPDIKDTTKDTSKEINKILMNSLSNSIKNKMISENTMFLFSLFGDALLAKDLVDIIFSTKLKVENYQNKELDSAVPVTIYGDIWIDEIEKQAQKFIYKVKEYRHKNKPIKNLKEYWFKTMETFWEDVLVMEKKYNIIQLSIWFEQGTLELENVFMEFNSYTKGLTKRKKREKRYEYVYLEKHQS